MAGLLLVAAPWPAAALGMNGSADGTTGASMIQPAEFGAQLAAAQRVVAACAGAAAGCRENDVPPDTQAGVAGRPGSFHAGWQWLRDAVRDAQRAPPANRAEAMRQAEAHLRELAAEANGGGAEARADDADEGTARAAARRILAGDEFQAEAGPSWLDRQFARLQGWLLRLLLGAGRVGARNPWLAPAIEWTCFALAIGGLMVFVRRSLQRQALRIALGEAATATQVDRERVDWARVMEEQAATGAWREAVHAVYWAAIASLERRRAWRPNPTRTPREFLRLLRPGSEAQRALRGLTGQMERLWYGHAEAAEGDFVQAREHLRAIEVADLQRASTDERQAGAMAATGAA